MAAGNKHNIFFLFLDQTIASLREQRRKLFIWYDVIVVVNIMKVEGCCTTVIIIPPQRRDFNYIIDVLDHYCLKIN